MMLPHINQIVDDPSRFMANLEYWVRDQGLNVKREGTSIVIVFDKETKVSNESPYALDLLAEALRGKLNELRGDAMRLSDKKIQYILQQINAAATFGKKTEDLDVYTTQ